MNVKVNAAGLKDRTYAENILAEGAEIQSKAIALEAEIMAIVNGKIN